MLLLLEDGSYRCDQPRATQFNRATKKTNIKDPSYNVQVGF